MNAHDSEKVIGTLVSRGYSQVEMPEAAEPVLYNTCSIRDKAEQKVFNRLQQFKRAAGKGKIFGVLGCVAQDLGSFRDAYSAQVPVHGVVLLRIAR
jgi:tRNA-2-methylthio-N6-dimethylallyladenosine synthase